MLARDDECWSYRTGFHCNGPSMSDWYPKRTFANLLEDAAKRWGPHEALFHEGRRFSFDALKAQVDATPRDFLKSASRRGTGSRYGCRTVPSGYSHSWNFPRSAPLPWPLNTRFRAVDLEYLLRQSDARTLISVDRSVRWSSCRSFRRSFPRFEPRRLHQHEQKLLHSIFLQFPVSIPPDRSLIA